MAAAPTPHELKEAWLSRALERAGIDRNRWDPQRGVDENRPTIEAVYDYYGRLFLEHPHLEWAGMASTIGPAFYAGFRDLGVLPDALRRAVIALLGRASRRLATRVAGDLGFYETTFLRMQKKIFEDQAPMHEAYLAGGVAEIEKLYRARIIDIATLEAWREIEAGWREADAASIERGNRMLLFREQRDIIDRFYVRMLQHDSPEGSVFTYLLTLAGAPSVPGADSYPERYPLTFVARLPRAAISVCTPLADGNIAVFANRWKLIDDDTLPDYLALVRDHADEARAIVATPIGRRVGRYRLIARAGSLIAGALTRWHVEVGPPAATPRPLALRRTRPVLAAETGATTIRLMSAPTRQSAGFAEGSDSRIWTNRDRRRPFEVTVELPARRAFSARAEMAVMISSVRGGNPDRLTVQMPPAGLAQAEALLAEYAAEWGFPADAVAGWHAGCERRVSSDRDYSTHAFTPEDVGFVHLEFQASHHVRDGEVVVAALFSWRADR
jgi:hypothetical protein